MLLQQLTSLSICCCIHIKPRMGVFRYNEKVECDNLLLADILGLISCDSVLIRQLSLSRLTQRSLVFFCR